MKLQSKFLKLYHSFTISDEWEGSLQADAEKIAEEFAIGFAEWIDKKENLMHLIKIGYTTKQLLEIYKKEKGL
jgi:hypothetical protein